MNQIVDNFNAVLEFAQTYGLPMVKKRAILREYLQVMILDLLYRQKQSAGLFFVGGTSLRLLYGLDRFSQDLDFDTKSFSFPSDLLLQNMQKELSRENISVDLYKNVTRKRSYFELRFKNLLRELKISSNEEEKLVIKFDFEHFWQGQRQQIILLNRYGFLANVVTMPLSQILVQKIFAYLHRGQTLPRDIYDMVWILSRGEKIDEQFLKTNKLTLGMVGRARKKFVREKRTLPDLKTKLRPFLIKEGNARKLDFFPQLIESIST